MVRANGQRDEVGKLVAGQLGSWPVGGRRCRGTTSALTVLVDLLVKRTPGNSARRHGVADRPGARPGPGRWRGLSSSCAGRAEADYLRPLVRHRDISVSVLRRVLATVDDEDVRQTAESVLLQLDAPTAPTASVFSAPTAVCPPPAGAGACARARYSLALKRRIFIDLVALALLFTIRTVAGAAVVSVVLSSWFVAFAFFSFLTLAVLNRQSELSVGRTTGRSGLPGRAYTVEDTVVLAGLGAASGIASVVVLALYVQSPESTDALRPARAALGSPIFCSSPGWDG